MIFTPLITLTRGESESERLILSYLYNLNDYNIILYVRFRHERIGLSHNQLHIAKPYNTADVTTTFPINRVNSCVNGPQNIESSCLCLLYIISAYC